MQKINLDIERNVYVGLITSGKNVVKLRDMCVKGKINCCLVKPTLIVDPLQLAAATYKAVHSHLRNEMITKHPFTEILFNLSPSKHIGKSLKKFSISEEDVDFLFVAIGEDKGAEDVKRQIEHITETELTHLAHLNELNDLEEIKKLYQITDQVLSVSNLTDAVVTRVATKSCNP